MRKVMNFYINEKVDLQQLKPQPATHYIQLKNFEVLEKLQKHFNDRHISCFLSGTGLLGAIRHGGLIPWREEVEIGLMKTDFETLCSQTDSLKKAGLRLSSPILPSSDYRGKGGHRIYDENGKYGVNLQVYEEMATGNREESIRLHQKFTEKAGKLLRAPRQDKADELKGLQDVYHREMQQWATGDTQKIVWSSIVSPTAPSWSAREAFFPLREVPFYVYKDQKKKKWPVPKLPEAYLIHRFGPDYQYFPKELFPPKMPKDGVYTRRHLSKSKL